jgi:2-methylisocitrate lyase-like PEP mutase family enzyme
MARLDLHADRAILAPGVYDALSALLAARAGAEAIYLSGASLAYTQLGRPDLGFLDLTRVADATARITDRVETPLIVDADTGFGNALNVQRAVRTLEKAGAAAIQLEDQAMPKRCGHLDGKTLIPIAEMAGKIAAAVDARANEGFRIIARTDAVSVDGFNAALDRAETLIEAGADILFIEALRTEDEMAKAAARFARRIPMLANMVEGGRTPIRSLDALSALGFRVVIAPGALARAVAFASQEFLAALIRDGASTSYASRMLTFDQLNGVLGLMDLVETGRAFDASAKKAAE